MSDDLLNYYLQSHAHKWTQLSLKDSQKHLKYYFKFANSQQLSPATETAITAFQQYMHNKNISIVTKYGYLRHLKRFIQYTAPNLADLVQLPRYQQGKTKTFLTKKKHLVKSLINAYPKKAADIRDKTICALYYIDKLSVRNIEALTTIDIDPQSAELRIVSKQRFQNLHPGTAELIQYYLKIRPTFKPASNQLFVTNTGKSLTYDDIFNLIHAQVRP